MKSRLISICIPTYNGGATLNNILQEIALQLTDDFEVIISDDASTDDTLSIAMKYSDKYPNIRVFQNDKNLGMDGNFHQTMTYASGKYIWFCGQDDLLCSGILDNVKRILMKAPDIGVLNLNFAQYDHSLKNCITPSFFELCSFNKELIQKKKELYFDTPEKYYQVFTQPPSFLPSVVMLREFWQQTNVKQFYGTYFVQMGVLLLNLHKKKIGVLTTPMIKGRIPDDQWQINGNKLFAVMTGALKAKKIAFEQNRSLPKKIFQRDKNRYLLNYLFLVFECKKLGMTVSSEIILLLRFLFKSSILYYLYIMPIISCPMSVLVGLVAPGKLLKKVLFASERLAKLKY